MKHFYLLHAIAMAFLLHFAVACGTKSKQAAVKQLTPIQSPVATSPIASQSPTQMLRPIVIYQTRADYDNCVPVQLSSDKKQIVSYPSRGDIGTPGNFATPIKLEGGYLHDRRGVGPNTAFLSLSYDEYAALPQDPSSETLMSYIIDDDPLIFLALCDRSELPDESIASLELYCRTGFPGAKLIIDKRKK